MLLLPLLLLIEQLRANEKIAERIVEAFDKADELNDADQKALMELIKKLEYDVDNARELQSDSSCGVRYHGHCCWTGIF